MKKLAIGALVLLVLLVAVILAVADEPPDYDHFTYCPVVANDYDPGAPTPTPVYVRPTPTPLAPAPTEVLPTMRPTVTPPGDKE